MTDDQTTQTAQEPAKKGTIDKLFSDPKVKRFTEEVFSFCTGVAVGKYASDNVGSILPDKYAQDKTLKASTTVAVASASYTGAKILFNEILGYFRKEDKKP